MVKENVETLEKGNIFFFYRPKVGRETVSGMQDVERFYFALVSEDQKHSRLFIVGHKKLPDIEQAGQKYWGYVAKVTRKPEQVARELGAERYGTKTRGKRTVQGARPAGEGVYQIVRHEDHTHLVYELELPGERAEVQKALNIEPEGSYILSIKNPEKPSPRRMGLPRGEKPDYPQRLKKLFEGRRFFDADPPDFLNYEGTAILLITAKEDVSKELGITLDAEKETADTAEIFTELKLNKSEHPVEPLLKGEWK